MATMLPIEPVCSPLLIAVPWTWIVHYEEVLISRQVHQRILGQVEEPKQGNVVCWD